MPAAQDFRDPGNAPGVTPPPGHPRFPGFDGLRGLAALGIVFTHASGAYFNRPVSGTLLSRLDLGVTILFVLSGFLLYRPFVAARFGLAPRRTTGRYAAARFLRIVPGYYLALTLLSIYPGLPRMFNGDWWIYYGFGQTYSADTINTGIGQAWTIGVEITLYAMLPLWAFVFDQVLRRVGARRTLRVEMFALIVASIATVAIRQWSLTHDRILSYTILGTFDSFAIGMAIALLSVALELAPRPRLSGALARSAGPAWLAALAIFVVVATTFDLPRGFALVQHFTALQWLGEHVAYGLIAALLVLPPAFERAGRSVPNRVLNFRPLAWIGVIAYGVYLWHSAILLKIAQQSWLYTLPGDTEVNFIILGLLATLPIAAASYYLVERPFLRLKMRGAYLEPGRVGGAVVSTPRDEGPPVALAGGLWRRESVDGGVADALGDGSVPSAGGVPVPPRPLPGRPPSL